MLRLTTVAALAAAVLTTACGGGTSYVHDPEYLRDIRAFGPTAEVTAATADSVLGAYTIEFSIPNPLSAGGSGSRRREAEHMTTIYCHAVLLDDTATKADILALCAADSLDGEGCAAFREEYREEHLRDGMFRIRITMETGFSEKSFDPRHWALFVETIDGVMVEPSDIILSPTTADRDTVFSSYSRQYIRRNMHVCDMTLYFKRITFFGDDLLGSGNSPLVFVMSRERKEVARVAWHHADKPDDKH